MFHTSNLLCERRSALICSAGLGNNANVTRGVTAKIPEVTSESRRGNFRFTPRVISRVSTQSNCMQKLGAPLTAMLYK